MTVHIRSARPEEAQLYLDLWRAAGSEPSVTDDVDSILTFLEHSPDAMLVAERDGEVVGTLIAAFDGWRGTFYRLAVQPDAKRSGVATRLVEEGAHSLAARGCRKVEAIVVEAKPAATAFWRSAGFQRDDRVGRYVRELSC